MDPQLLDGFAKLGPAMGAVVAIGGICYYLIKLITMLFSKMLEMFDKHTLALGSVEKNMQAHTESINKMGTNLEANTKATLKMVDLLDRHNVGR
jgi:hypothetical protein